MRERERERVEIQFYKVMRITLYKVLWTVCTYNALSIWTTQCRIAGTVINAVAVVVCESWSADAAIVVG